MIHPANIPRPAAEGCPRWPTTAQARNDQRRLTGEKPQVRRRFVELSGERGIRTHEAGHPA